jgi:hypothetical protein
MTKRGSGRGGCGRRSTATGIDSGMAQPPGPLLACLLEFGGPRVRDIGLEYFAISELRLIVKETS